MMLRQDTPSLDLSFWSFLTFLHHDIILANRPDLVGTVAICRPKPDVPPDDPKKPIRPDLSRSRPKNTVINPLLPVLFVLQSEFKFLRCLLAFFMYLSVAMAGSYPNKTIRIIGHSGCSFSCNFPLSARNCVHF